MRSGPEGVLNSGVSNSKVTPGSRVCLRDIAVLFGVSVAVALRSFPWTVPDSVLQLDLDPGRFIGAVFQGVNAGNLGSFSNGTSVGYLPMATVYFVLHHVGISVFWTERLWFACLLGLATVGFYLVYLHYWRPDGSGLAIVAGLLFGLSPYVLLNAKGATSLLIPYVGIPWLSLAVVAFLERPSLVRWAVVGVVGGVLFAGVNPPATAIAWFTSIGLGIGIASMGPNWGIRVVRCVAAVVALMIFSMWWLIPFVQGTLASGVAAYFITDPLSEGASKSSLVEVLRLTGLWALYEGWKGVPYYPSVQWLTDRWVRFATLLAPAMTFVVMVRYFRKRVLWPFVLLVCVGVWMAMASYPPADPYLTGRLYLWVYRHVVIFRAFRSNYKWVGALAAVFSLFAPQLVSLLNQEAESSSRLGGRWKSAVGLVLVGSVLVAYSVPFLASSVVPTQFRLGSVPDYWKKAVSWLGARSAVGRTLFLPNQGFSIYTWGAPYGDLATALGPVSAIMPHAGSNIDSVATSWLSLFNDPSTLSVRVANDILYRTGAKFVVVQGDIVPSVYNSAPVSDFINLFNRDKSFRLVKQFGPLDVYVASWSVGSVESSKAIVQVVSDQGLAADVGLVPKNVVATFGVARAKLPVGIASVAASSVWDGLFSEYGPTMAVDGNASTAWVPNRSYGRGSWLRISFDRPTRLGTIRIIARVDGVDAVPRCIDLVIGSKVIPVRMTRSGFGSVSVNLVSRAVMLRIVNTYAGGPNVGIAEVSVAGMQGPGVQYPSLRPGQIVTYGMMFGNKNVGAGSATHFFGSRGNVSVRFSGRFEPDVTAPLNDAVGSLVRLSGASAVTASTTWGNNLNYSALAGLRGRTDQCWVSGVAGGVGQWMRVVLDRPRKIVSIKLFGRNDGVDAEVNRIGISVDGRKLGSYKVDLVGGRDAVIPIGRVVSRLQVTILGVGSVGRSRNVGLSLSIPGVSVRLNRPRLMHVLGVSNAKVSERSSFEYKYFKYGDWIPSEVVVSGMARLAGGLHSVGMELPGDVLYGRVKIVEGQVQGAAAVVLKDSSFRASAWRGIVPGGSSYLVFNTNFDPTWTASSGGVLLKGPFRLNGFANGWRVVPRRVTTISYISSLPMDELAGLADAVLALVVLVYVGGKRLIWRRRSTLQ